MVQALQVAALALPVADRVVDEFELRQSAKILDRKHRREHGLQTAIIALARQQIHLQKALIRLLLNFNQVRNLNRAVLIFAKSRRSRSRVTRTPLRLLMEPSLVRAKPEDSEADRHPPRQSGKDIFLGFEVRKERARTRIPFAATAPGRSQAASTT